MKFLLLLRSSESSFHSPSKAKMCDIISKSICPASLPSCKLFDTKFPAEESWKVWKNCLGRGFREIISLILHVLALWGRRVFVYVLAYVCICSVVSFHRSLQLELRILRVWRTLYRRFLCNNQSFIRLERSYSCLNMSKNLNASFSFSLHLYFTLMDLQKKKRIFCGKNLCDRMYQLKYN